MTRSGKLPVDSPYLQCVHNSTADCQRGEEHHSIEESRIPPEQHRFVSLSHALSSSDDTSLVHPGAPYEVQNRAPAGNKRHLSGDDPTAQANEDHHLARKRARNENGETERALTHLPEFGSSADDIKQKSVHLKKRQLKKGTSSPPGSTLSDAATTMLSRPEGTGGVRTVKLARGHPGSPVTRTVSVLSRISGEQISRIMSIQEPRVQNSGQILAEIGLLELLQQDGRPTFIIDVADTANLQPGLLNLLFVNRALKARPELLGHVRGKADDPSLSCDSAPAFIAFKQWATSLADGNPLAASSPTYQYARLVWTSSTLRKRIRVVACDANSTPAALSGTPNQSETPTSRLRSSSGYFNLTYPAQDFGRSLDPASLTTEDPTEVLSSEQPTGCVPVNSVISNAETESMTFLMSPRSLGERADSYQGLERSVSTGNAEALNAMSDRDFFDWTRLPELSALPPHIRFACSVNWAATSLGPIESWDADLRTMCNLIMASPHPAAMYWGPDLIAIYNEAYILLAGNKHPTLMGQSYKVAWAEIWHAVEDVFASAISSAQATMKDDDCLFMNRGDYLEETYFSWSIVPVIGDDGSVVGLYNPAFEKTRRKIAERRMLTLREIGERTAAAREVSKFWPLLLKGLRYNELDAPLVLIYSVAEDANSDASLVQSGGMVTEKTLVLEGSLGVLPGHRLAPEEIDLSTSMEGFAPVFRDAVKADKPLILSEENGTLDKELLEGIQWRGYGDPSPTVVICPIHPTTGESTLGFLVMGTNPRRSFDEDYNLFVQLLARQLATSVASVVLFEEEIRKGRRAARLAAQDRIELSNQLAARTQEAVESETKFTRMAELAPVGMIIADSTGRFNYCNDTWYDLASYPKSEQVGDDWIKYIADDDRPLVIRQWRKIIDEQVPISSEFCFKKPWQDKEGNQLEDTWVLFSAYPEKGPDGQVKRIFGTVTDISTQKFAEELQKRRMEEAVELKRQQETFIDITSHEMRNPLSAILQCADEIASSLTEARHGPSLQSHVLDSTIDAAQTITLCAQHQRRVVDDVLTLSKLDSARLLVIPVDAQPDSVVQRALKMFDGELQTADISLDVRVNESLHMLRVDWVRLDPSRLLQILINLTTNAIKFTTTQEKRSIIVHLGASLSRPSEQPDKTMHYVPSRSKEKDTTSEAEWGLGEVIYLTFAIQDTGRGLTEGEKKLLFLRSLCSLALKFA
jgi:PAS domain S-box-containing protein